MHILVVNIYFAPYSYGGATVVAEEVARALVREHGAHVTAISAISREDLEPYATLLSECDGIQNYMINLPPGRSYAEHYANPQVAERVAQIARRVEPDLAHLHCVQEVGADTIAVLKSLGLPVILSTHDYWWICERQFMLRPDGRACPQNPVRAAACRGCVDDFDRAQARSERLMQLGNMADLVTAPSRFARDLQESSGLAPGRFEVWENGITPPRPGFLVRQSIRRATDPGTTFAFLGGPSAMKGWPLVERAFQGLGRSDFRGLVVDGSLDGSWWQDRPVKLDGDWQVRPGYTQETIDAFFAEIDVLLFVSQWHETYGLTLREALARGIRVIQTEAGGATEHDAWDAVTMLPLDAGPQDLQRAVLEELERPMRGTAPRKMRSWDEQAAELLEFARPLFLSTGVHATAGRATVQAAGGANPSRTTSSAIRAASSAMRS